MAVRYRLPGEIESVAAFTKNIGTGGAFILTGTPAHSGSTITVLIDREGMGAIELGAEVRWSVAHESEAHEAGMGVQFVALDADQLRALAERLETLPKTIDS
jgi:uncharacterized protein (TIGR02266 family)